MDGKQDASFPLDSILMENWLEKKKDLLEMIELLQNEIRFFIQ